MNSELLSDFKKTVERLDEMLREPHSDMQRDAAIKRFELCFDLSWKTIKQFARVQGVECNSPRSCFKTAFELILSEKLTQ